MARSRVDVRELESRDYEACLELQRLTWGSDYRELVPPTILAISQKVGGVLAGAFELEDERLLGFVYGITGFSDRRPVHWSHMLAVRAQARGRGIGLELKRFQRRLLLARGCVVMFWTFDPLIARNANLNLNRLGARPVEYVRDMYGSDTGNALHQGLGTDRFVVEWRLDEEAAEERLSGPVVSIAPPLRGEPIVDLERRSALDDAARAPVWWLELPRDVEELRLRDLALARAWRALTREALERALACGFSVRGPAFSADGARCWYRLAAGSPR